MTDAQQKQQKRCLPVPHLAAYRRKSFMTQEELGTHVGVTSRTITRIEAGYPARLRTLRAIANILDVSPMELVEVNPADARTR